MATINNLEEAISTQLANTTLTDVADQTGVQSGTITDASGETQTVFTSSESSVSISNDADVAILTGISDTNIDASANTEGAQLVGNDGSNTITAGSGNDQVSTGDGDDTVSLGAGDDVVEISGSGNKVIDGGEGDDTFIIKANADGTSHSTFTGLNVGDKVRINADANGDGQITFDDVDITEDAGGNVVFTLKNGVTFTLEGVNADQAVDGTIKYAIGTDEDGNLIVDLTG